MAIRKKTRPAAPSAPGPDAAKAQGEHPTGKAEKPVEVNLGDALHKRVDTLQERGWFKSDVLRKDLNDCLKQKSGKDSTPLVLSIDDVLRLCLLAFNWQEGKKYTFEFHWELLLKAGAVFARAVGKKPTPEIKELAEDIRNALAGTLKKPFPKSEKQQAKERRKEEAADLTDALIDASIGVVVNGLLLIVAGDQVYEAFSDKPRDKDDNRPKVEKAEAVGEFFEAVEGMTSALIVIFSRGGGKQLGKWLADFKHKEEHHYEAEQELARRWDKVKGVSEEKQQENEKARKKEWEKAAREPASVAKAHHFAELINHWANLIKAVTEAWEAYRGLHPADIDEKEWVLQAPWATGALYKLSLEKTAENKFEGKLTAKGLAHPEEREFRQAIVVEVEKASCEVTRDEPLAPKLKFKWKPKGEESKKLPSPGDVFFGGTEEKEEEVEFHSTILLSDALKLGLPAAGEFVRKMRPGDYVKFGVSVLRVIAACWGLMPRSTREKAKNLMLEKLAPRLEAFFKVRGAAWARLGVGPRIEPLTVELNTTKPPWTLTFGLQGPHVQLKLGWDFIELMEMLLVKLKVAEDEAPGMQLKANALVPTTCKMRGTLGQFGELALDLERREQKVERKEATASAVIFDKLKQLPLLGDELTRFEEFCKEYKIAVRVGQPKVRGGDPKFDGKPSLDDKPGLEIPLICQMEELATPWSGSFPATVTLTYTATAEVVANLLPELRVILLGWGIGWTVGSFINELPATQEAMELYGKWYVEFAAHEDWSRDYTAMDEWVVGLQKAKWIIHGDAVVAFIKSPYLAAQRYCAKHKIISALNRVVPLNDRAIGYRKTLAERIAAARKDPHALGMEMKSIGQAMALAHVLGHDQFPAQVVEQQLAAESGGKPLTGIEADFYRFYLYPGEYDQRRKAFLDMHRAERERLSKNFVQGKLSDAKAIVYERLFTFVNDNAHKQFIELLHSPFPEASTENTIQVLQQDGKWRWLVQRSMANEEIKVELLAHNLVWPDPVVERADHTKALLTGCNIHWLSGDFSAVKGALLQHQVKERRPTGGEATGAWTYLRVTGQGGDKMDGPRYFLETDDQGKVVSAWRG
jgi:hypothetical protein